MGSTFVLGRADAARCMQLVFVDSPRLASARFSNHNVDSRALRPRLRQRSRAHARELVGPRLSVVSNVICDIAPSRMRS